MNKKTVKDIDLEGQTRADARGLQRADGRRQGHRRQTDQGCPADHQVRTRTGRIAAPDESPGTTERRV